MLATHSLRRLVGLGIAGILFLVTGLSTRAASVAAGSAVSFSVTADGSAPFSYQWRKDATNISGATAQTYKIASVTAHDAGTYTVVVSNSAGSTTSDSVALTVQAATVTPAVNQIVTTGHDVELTAAGAANGGQWQVSVDGGATWSNLANSGTYNGVTSNTLTVSGVGSALNGNSYRYQTSAGAGGITTLSIAPNYFPFPVGIAADRAGNLYVSDTATDILQKISTSGAVSLLAGSSGQIGTADGSGASARFNDPAGVAAAADGTLSVADYANGTIRQVTPAGGVTTLAGSTVNRGNVDGTGSAATFASPLGLAQDASGNLYVADAQNNTVRKVSASGSVSTLAGKAGATGTTDGAGAAARFNHPTGVAVDGAGNVFVADSTNNTIRKITVSGSVTTLAGVPGVSGFQDGNGLGALFSNPGGLAVDAGGNLLVADTGNSTIRKITPAGAVTTLAGLPGIAGLIDGAGSAAWFNQPQGVVLDAAGNLYVADTGNAAIRRVTPAGTVSTLALSGGLAPTDNGSTSTGTSPSSGPISPPTSGSSGGGGGGDLGACFAVALGISGLLRYAGRRR